MPPVSSWPDNILRTTVYSIQYYSYNSSMISSICAAEITASDHIRSIAQLSLNIYIYYTFLFFYQ